MRPHPSPLRAEAGPRRAPHPAPRRAHALAATPVLAVASALVRAVSSALVRALPTAPGLAPGLARHLPSALALALLIAVPVVHGQDSGEALWIRTPAISPDGSTIAFTWRGDLYRVPATGGEARAITSHPGHDFMPVWSPDGKTLAFASDRHGHFDLFVVPAEGGTPRRLTFHSAPEFPYAFTPDGSRVVFGASRLDAASNRQHPSAAQPELYQVPVEGGRPSQLLTTPAEAVSFSADGRWMAYHDRKGGENEWRKHQQSAIARDLWIADLEAGTHRRVTDFAGEDRNPVLSADGRVVYYLSEEGGTSNVHRRVLDPGGTESGDRESGGTSLQGPGSIVPSGALTRFEGHPVRFLSRSAGGTLAFTQGGRLWRMEEGAEPRPVPVRIAADQSVIDERVIPVTGGFREMAVAPGGREVAFLFRGEVFVASVDGGTPKRITNTPEEESGVRYSPDGSRLFYASQRGGRWGIWEARRTREGERLFHAATRVEERPLVVNGSENAQPLPSPDGSELAYIENRNTLRIRNLETGDTRTLLTEDHIWSTGPNHRFSWSPDGQWILFDLAVPGLAPGEVGLVRADGSGPVLNLTESGFDDGAAQWVQGGRAILWRSNRDGLGSLARTGASQADVYALFLTQQGWDEFRLTKGEFALLQEAREEEENGPDGPAGSGDGEPAPVEFELDGIRDRRARLTIHSSTLGDALLSEDGETLYYLARFERGFNLWSTELRSRETKMLASLQAGSGQLAWDGEGKKIFLLADGGISTIDPATGKRESISIRGEMRTSRAAEWAAQFDLVRRRVRDTFYTRDFHGADWEALTEEYGAYLPHISNPHEFAELLSELLGELNVSHSGARHTPSMEGGDETASLGIFHEMNGEEPGIRITEVLRGGPLDRAGMHVLPGTRIEAIDGVEIGAETDPDRLLNRMADRNVVLRLRDPSGSVREIVAKPISRSAEDRLRYERWVRINEEEVERRSGGRLGYVHIPGMNDGAYRSVFEEVMGRHAGKEGLVVDTRFNGGGDLVADLEMFLSGERFFDYTTDTRSTGFEPNFRWTRPSVALVNEANYSDGHCFAWAYREMGIGPLVGMPVPGTCTFGGWQTLPDGIRWGVPGMGVKETRTGQFLENLQTAPDLRVENDPVTVAAGRDLQLEAAIANLMERIEAAPGGRR